jgi:hypothetical protein
MSCGHDDNIGGTSGCVCEVLRAIKDIQDAAIDDECLECTTSCFMEPLGTFASPGNRRRADTRVFTLQTDDGDFFKAFFKDRTPNEGDCLSIFFRVENVFDNCCATLRVLKPFIGNKEANLFDNKGKLNFHELCKVNNWKRTNSCLTIDTKCFCAIQCVDDIDLNICD